MTTKEFSMRFDVLWNNISSNQSPGLNEYEKSVVLTKAQKQLVNEYFNIRVDGAGGGFDGSQRRQYDFSSIIKTRKLDINLTIPQDEMIDSRSKVYKLPPDYFLAVNEQMFYKNKQYVVIPIDYAEYQRLMMKPYQYPPKRAAWRLITNDSTVELIGNFEGTPAYYMRYVRTLNPIILTDLGEEYGYEESEYGESEEETPPVPLVTIDGKYLITECELPEECHEEILERAVTLAKIIWQGETSTQAQAASSKER
jgi:hypothetical protein